MKDLLDLAVKIAKEAGALLLDRPDQLSIDTKTSDIDIVTQMDKQSEKLIMDAILAARPDDGIVGEEGANRPSKSGYTWVIDPIDGTVNYFYNLHGWSVSIAIRDSQGVVVGVVYAPTINAMYTAVRGGGSYLNGAKLTANNPVELNRALLATGFHYRAEVRQVEVEQLNKLIDKVRDIRRNGSAAIDICHVAAGLVDGYYEMGLHPWDRDAADLIATEAGATVTVHAIGAEELTIAAGAHLYGQLKAELLA